MSRVFVFFSAFLPYTFHSVTHGVYAMVILIWVAADNLIFLVPFVFVLYKFFEGARASNGVNVDVIKEAAKKLFEIK